MDFTYAPKSYHLTFADNDLAGLEVTAGSLSIADVLRMDLTFATGPDDTVEATVARMNDRLAIFAGALQSWNLTGASGAPVGTDLESVKAQDVSLVLRIIREWWKALEVVPAPLPNGSAGTPPTDLESIPMTAASSPSPPN